jgi:glycosyltransferase involved in cell wall biosynthesis
MLFLFVDDGSTDGTPGIIESLKSEFPENVQHIFLRQNRGKSHAVKSGVQHALSCHAASHIGYLDADLSTPLEQYALLYSNFLCGDYGFCFGSRIKLLGASIKRKKMRHLIGRFIATIIDTKYQLGMYDTQCGAKIFSRATAEAIFSEPFHTSWFFDVELFLRIRKYLPGCRGAEMPLNHWEERKGSKLGFRSIFRVANELVNLYTHY